LRDTRKTERAASQFLIGLEVRAVPFALLIKKQVALDLASHGALLSGLAIE
jgi:hypothetical protein